MAIGGPAILPRSRRPPGAGDLATATERLAGQVAVVETVVERAFAASGDRIAGRAGELQAGVVEAFERAADRTAEELGRVGERLTREAAAAADRVAGEIGTFEAAVARSTGAASERIAEQGDAIEQLLGQVSARLDASATQLGGAARRGAEALHTETEALLVASDKAAAQAEVLATTFRNSLPISPAIPSRARARRSCWAALSRVRRRRCAPPPPRRWPASRKAARLSAAMPSISPRPRATPARASRR